MFTNTEKQVYKWNIETKELVCRYDHKEANFIYLVLSNDNKMLRSNAYGPYVFEINLEKDET